MFGCARKVLVGLAVLGFVGCAGAPRPEGLKCGPPEQAGLQTRAIAPDPVTPADVFATELMATFGPARSPLRIARPGQYDIEVLVASTGGQWAAFGAGFLSAWAERSDDQTMPAFDIATGASAGAYVAPFAILGPEYTSRLTRLRGIDNAGLVTRNPLFGLFGTSVYRTQGLDAIVREVLDARAIAELASQGREGRALFVAAVDLDSTAFEIFNLTDLADTENGQACVSEAVLASSAIPVIFPPRVIDDGLYSDAGLRDHLFLAGLADYVAGSGQRVRITAILNGDLKIEGTDVQYGITGVAGRAFEIANDDGYRASVLELLSLAQRRGIDVRAITGAQFEPSVDAQDPQLPFDRAYTEELFDYGRDLASRPQIPWIDEKALEQLARILQ